MRYSASELAHTKTWRLRKDRLSIKRAITECERRIATGKPGLSQMLMQTLPDELEQIEHELKRRRDAIKGTQLTKQG